MAGQPSVRCRFDAEVFGGSVVRPFRDKLKNPVSRALLVANLSNCFDVSIQAATNRLKDLGYIKTSDTTDYSYASAIMDFAGVVGS